MIKKKTNIQNIKVEIEYDNDTPIYMLTFDNFHTISVDKDIELTENDLENVQYLFKSNNDLKNFCKDLNLYLIGLGDRPKSKRDFGSIQNTKIANYAIHKFNIIGIENMVYLYDDGIYKNKNKFVYDISLLRKKLLQEIPDLTNQDLNEIESRISASTLSIKNIDQNYLGIKNGVLDIKNKKVEKFSSKYIVTQRYDVIYDENIEEKNPEESKELHTMMCEIFDNDEDLIRLFWQCAGVSLVPSFERRASFFLKGTGNNGKSILVNWLSYVIGLENVSTIRFEDLKQEFVLDDIINSQITIASELPKQYYGDVVHVYKGLVGGDLMRINPKGKRPYFQKYKGRFWLMSNYLLNVSDGTKALLDRLIYLPFDHDFRDAPPEQWNYRKGLIFSEFGKNWFFYHALNGLYEYKEQGFVKCSKSLRLSNESTLYNNITLRYMLFRVFEEKKEFEGKYGIRSEEVYNEFILWSMREGYKKSLLKQNFYQGLLELGVLKDRMYYNKKQITGFIAPDGFKNMLASYVNYTD